MEVQNSLSRQCLLEVIREDLKGLQVSKARQILQSFTNVGLLTERDFHDLVREGVFIDA